MSERTAILTRIRALRAKTVANGCTKHEATAARAKARAMMAAHEVSDAELAEDEREPYFDADPQAYYAARAEEEAKRRERVARAAEEYEREQARRSRREHWTIALIITGIFIVLFAGMFATLYVQEGFGGAEAFLKTFQLFVILALVGAGSIAAMAGLPFALRGGYFIIKDRFGPETAAASAAGLAALAGALTGALYPTNTLVFLQILIGLALIVATGLLIPGVPLHLMGWFNDNPKERMVYQASWCLVLTCCVAAIIAGALNFF